MANHEIELQVAPMSDETMDYLDTLIFRLQAFQHRLLSCNTKKSVILLMLLPAMSTSWKKAREKGQQRASVPPFLGIVRSERSDHMPA